MARVSLVNSTLPNTVQYNDDDGDQYDRAHLAYLSANYDLHTHRASYGLGVGRLTSTAVAAAYDVAISGDTLTWNNSTPTTFVAMSLSGTQTVTGVKTFSGNNTHSGTLAMSGVATFTASPIIDSSYKIVLGSGGTTTDIGLQRTAANTLTIDSAPTTGTANTVNIGTSGTSNALKVWGTLTTPNIVSPAATALVINATGQIHLFAGSATGWKIDSGSGKAFYPTDDNAHDIGINGTNDVRNIYLQNDIYKAGSAYTNPDFVFEHHFTGRVTEKNKGGAKKYKGRKSLDVVRDHVRQHHRFETIPDKQTGMFDRGDIALELIEEAYLHMFDLHDRIKVLESS